jgi:hypothetical protein
MTNVEAVLQSNFVVCCSLGLKLTRSYDRNAGIFLEYSALNMNFIDAA